MPPIPGANILNFYDTATLIDAIKHKKPFHTFLKDSFFPDGPVFATENILVEYMEEDNLAAPFVAPRINGVTIAREGSKMESFKPGKVAPKRVLTIDDLTSRGFGEALYSNLTPQDRQAAFMAEDLDTLDKAIARRLEAMAADMMFTGKIVMQEMGDDGSVKDEKEVDFGIETYICLQGGWDTTEAGGKRIIADLDGMISLKIEKGLPVNTLVCSHEIANIIQYNDYLMKLRDNRNFSAFDQSETKNNADGSTLVCRLNVNGTWIDVVSYRDTYKDPYTGITVPFIPAGKVCLTAPGSGKTVYGAITQMERGATTFTTYAEKRVPKLIADDIGETREIRVATRPICYPSQKGAFLVASVLPEDNPVIPDPQPDPKPEDEES